MVKAVFVDFYGTIVHEDGAVIQKITQEIFDTVRFLFILYQILTEQIY